MKRFLLFFAVCCTAFSFSACGTDQIIVPDMNDEENDTVIYISPADSCTATTTDINREKRIEYSYNVKPVLAAN